MVNPIFEPLTSIYMAAPRTPTPTTPPTYMYKNSKIAQFQVLHEETNGEALITTGVGQHQMWAAQWYKLKEPRQWATSGGLGSMGFGLPSALGAAVAYDGTDKGRPKKVTLWSLTHRRL